jgi:hypothetical protein
MLMLLCILYHTGRFCFCDLPREDTANTVPFLMHLEHDLGRLLLRFAEKLLEYLHYEFHRSIIVVH